MLSPLPALVLAALLQGGSAAPEPGRGAADLWERVCSASLLRESRAARPVTAFDLELFVRSRGGAGSNDLHPRLRWMEAPAEAGAAPRSWLRFGISETREEGFGPDGYWLRDGDAVERGLAGRDFAEDRRQVDDLLRIVRSFVALTQPVRLRVSDLRALPERPAEIPRRHELARGPLRDLAWLELHSPDFQLAPPDVFDGPAPARLRLGVDPATGAARVALIEDTSGRAAPLLLALDEHRPLDDLRVPHAVRVFALEPGPEGTRAAERPHQEFFVEKGTLRARLSEADFRAPATR